MLTDIISSSISRHRLLEPGERPVVVALSGGADSVALLVALDELGYTCVAAHCNFHLRGEESNRDMRLCRDLCSRLGIDLYVRDFDVAARRKATGESVEMACRELRYRWFDSLLERLRAQAIAVAHHREDNEETLLLNLMRGSSLTGLTGMRPRHGFVVRPLLEASREQIEEYLRLKGQPFVVDSSNSSDAYLRNRLRHSVLPAMRQAFPDADRGLLASIDFLSQNRDFYEYQIRQLSERYLHDHRLDLSSLLREQPHARLLLFEMLRPMGFNMTHVDNILASASASGLTFSAPDYRLELSRGTLHLIPTSMPSPPSGSETVTLRRDILSPLHIVVTEHDIAEFKPRRNPRVAYFDISILSGDPLFELRPWQRGDRLQPFGMHATRLLSDVMRDARLSPDEKRSLRLLTRNGEILWAVGLRPSAHFPVTPDTRRFLRLEYKG